MSNEDREKRPTTRKMRVERTLPGRPQDVWAAWVDAEQLAQWFNPDPNVLVEVREVDAKKDGGFRVALPDPDGGYYEGEYVGTYETFDPPHELAFHVVDNSGAVTPPGTEAHFHVQLEPIPGGTRLVLTGGPAGEIDGVQRAEADWGACLDRLAGLLTSQTHGTELVAAATAGPETELILTRHLDAPPEDVYDAFLNPEHIDTWWGPDGCTTETHEMDPQEGGLWHHTMTVQDGTEFPNYVRYLELERPHRIVYENGDSRDGPPAFTSTLTFEAEDQGTRITMRSRFPTKESRDATLEYNSVESGYQTLSHLAAYLEGGEGR